MSGRQTKPGSFVSIRRFADDTAGLMRALGIGSAHIVGASMGGMIAREIALNYPERVMSLTLVCTMPKTDATTDRILQSWKTIRPSVAADEFFVVISPWLFTCQFYEQPEPMEAFLGIVRGNPFPQSPERFGRQCDAIATHDTSGRLAGIKKPTHVIVGTEDNLTPPAHSRALAAQIPGATLTEIPTCAHGLCWEKADEFNQAVLGFIGRHVAATSGA